MSSETRERVFILVALGLLVVALVAGGFSAGYFKGQLDMRAQLQRMQDDINAKNEELRKKDNHKEVQIVTEVVEVIKEVKIKGDTIIKEVKVYVPQESDAACTVPLGFVSMHDTAIRAGNATQAQAAPASADARAPAIDDAVQPPEWIKEPSGVPLSDVAAVNAKNAIAFGELRARYLGLREWANNQCYGL